MNWAPFGEAELAKMIDARVDVMEAPDRALWNLIRVPQVKWQLHPWGDESGGFWVVGIIGRQVVWYNDIEDGFNVSRYDAAGEIAEYWCNQDELNHAMRALLSQIELGEAPGRLGPPEPLK